GELNRFLKRLASPRWNQVKALLVRVSGRRDVGRLWRAGVTPPGHFPKVVLRFSKRLLERRTSSGRSPRPAAPSRNRHPAAPWVRAATKIVRRPEPLVPLSVTRTEGGR